MQAAGVFMRQAGCLSANWWGCRVRVRVYTRVVLEPQPLWMLASQQGTQLEVCVLYMVLVPSSVACR
jgi:hypothetical protein